MLVDVKPVERRLQDLTDDRQDTPRVQTRNQDSFESDTSATGTHTIHHKHATLACAVATLSPWAGYCSIAFVCEGTSILCSGLT